MKQEIMDIQLSDSEIDAIIDILNKFTTQSEQLNLPFLTFRDLKVIFTESQYRLIKKLCPANLEMIDAKLPEKNKYITPNLSLYSKRFVRLHEDIDNSFKSLKLELRKTCKENLGIMSGYRSPAYQTIILLKEIYESDFDIRKALKSVDLPGRSEHGQVPYHAIDLSVKNVKKFQDTNSYRWLLRNASTWGFALSYNETNTDFIFEPWHWHYVGKQL